MARRTLPGTAPLRLQGDLAARMVAGIHALLAERTRQSPAEREKLWHRDFSSHAAYTASVAPNRKSLRRCIGAVDPRLPATGIELVCQVAGPVKLHETESYTAYLAHWPVFDGVDAEGVVLEPKGRTLARIVALPDADWTPEQIAGVTLDAPLPPEAQFARRLAASGCRVLVPVLVGRGQEWSGNPRIKRSTRQPHREWVYRMAYEMGRHIIGYEVQKVLAAVDQFAAERRKAPIGVVGYGEGGLIALHAAALDPRIDAACVSGYLQEREGLSQEPIYRNVWNLLREFGDAGVASLIAPRALIVEASKGPRVGKQGSTPGVLVSPPFASTKREFAKVAAIYRKLKAPGRVALVGNGSGLPGSDAALAAFLQALTGSAVPMARGGARLEEAIEAPGHDPRTRAKRQFDQLVEYTQKLLRLSEYVRDAYWSKLDKRSVKTYQKSVERYRKDFWTELLGEMPPPSVAPSPRTRLILEQPKWRGYEVVLDVWPGVFAYGILCVPKGIEAGERRPVVVCQHGLEGRPNKVVDPAIESPYHAIGGQLADRGFVVFAPQNPYIGGDAFRVLQRLGNPLKCSLFSAIVRQHEVLTAWLASLPFVDGDRIGFYGLSYGGKTAMRVPALVRRYCLSICSGDFNEWVWKNVTIEWSNSYMFTGEYEMYEFGIGETFNYAEMAALIAPRPFMVERGHRDGVGLDEWVAFEYAKVRRLYADLHIPERTEIEYFDGPHEIHGVGTVRFLHRHLRWPEPAR